MSCPGQLKSTPAQKKYTIVGCGGCDKYELWSPVYETHIASCVQNYSVTRALAPTNCTFPTDAKAKDEVLLASPIAAKSVTFITHIASCIQYVVHYQGTGLSADAKA